jgi:hypothetical protein
MKNLTDAFMVFRSAKHLMVKHIKNLVVEYISRQIAGQECCLCNTPLAGIYMLCDTCFRSIYPSPVNYRNSLLAEYAWLLHRLLEGKIAHSAHPVDLRPIKPIPEQFTQFIAYKPTPLPDTGEHEPTLNFYEQDNVSCIATDGSSSEEEEKDKQDNEEIRHRNLHLGVPDELGIDELYIFLMQYRRPVSSSDRIILESCRKRLQIILRRRWREYEFRTKVEVIDEQLKVLKLRYLMSLKELRMGDALVLKESILDLKKERSRVGTLVQSLGWPFSS